MAIEDLQPGDVVLARPEGIPDAEPSARRVLAKYQSLENLWHVQINGHIIRTTGNHPFYVVERGWTPAQELAVGDRIAGELEGVSYSVEVVRQTEGLLAVFNVTVEEDHTYFVGAPDWGFAVWVHNEYRDSSSHNSLDKIIRKYGGKKLAEKNQNSYMLDSKRAAKQAAAEIAGDLGRNPKRIPLSSYNEELLSHGARNSKRIIGKHSNEKDKNGDPLAGFHDHHLGHSRFNESRGHYNAWGRFGTFKDNIHLFYQG